jgi:hypothetical protein
VRDEPDRRNDHEHDHSARDAKAHQGQTPSNETISFGETTQISQTGGQLEVLISANDNVALKTVPLAELVEDRSIAR